MIAPKNTRFVLPKKRVVVNDLPIFKRNTEGSGFVSPISKTNIGIGIPSMILNKPQVTMNSMRYQAQLPGTTEKPTYNLQHTGLVPRPKAAQLPGYRRTMGLPNRSDNHAADLLKRMQNKIARGGKLDTQEYNFIQQLAKTTGVK
jgi:hypothetical protein